MKTKLALVFTLIASFCFAVDLPIKLPFKLPSFTKDITCHTYTLDGMTWIDSCKLEYANGMDASLHFSGAWTEGAGASCEFWRDGRFALEAAPRFMATVTKGQVRDLAPMSLPMEVDLFGLQLNLHASYKLSDEWTVYGGPGAVIEYTRIETSSTPGATGITGDSDFSEGVCASVGVRYRINEDLTAILECSGTHLPRATYDLNPTPVRIGAMDSMGVYLGVAYGF